MKYRKKPVVIEAVQWFELQNSPKGSGIQMIDADQEWTCSQCGNLASKHGNCPTLEGWHIVCPGDWIVRGIKCEFYPVKAEIFAETYELVEE